VSTRAKERIIAAASRAFLEIGFEALSMSDLAERCGLTRRGLYHHFSSKEDLFRAMIRFNNGTAVLDGDEASSEALERGESAVEVITAWLDARFGETRRRIGATQHGRELNDAAFRLATDIMIEVSYESNRKLAELVAELCQRDQLRLRPGFTPERIGRLLGDGARGVNQARPPFPNDEIAQRYRDIVETMLFGCSEPVADEAPEAAQPKHRAPPRRKRSAE
jgi:AcrR family transcriptional regulator